MEPIDDEAKQIFAYWTKYRAHAGFPASPYSAIAARFHLPDALLGNPDAIWIGAEFSPKEVAGWPRYLCLYNVQFGRTIFHAGESVWFLGWPFTNNLEPDNEAAHTVKRYHEEHRDDPTLPEDARELLGLTASEDEQTRPRFLATQDAYLRLEDGDTLIRAGTAFDYDGQPGSSLFPLNRAAKLAKATYAEWSGARPGSAVKRPPRAELTK